MQSSYRLSPKAEEDLISIALYGIIEWGEERSNTYVESLYERFSWLAERPEIGRTRGEIKQGYKSWIHQQHVIFYTVNNKTIYIIGVIHGSSDIPTRLSSDN